MFKQASDTLPDPPDSEIGRSLAATVQRLAELRNRVGAGHGHASVLELSARDARLAASAASGMAAFLLCAE